MDGACAVTVCQISKRVEFDAGHRVPSHAGKCRNPHGHRYVVEVECEGQIVDEPGSPDDGMLVDFGDLKVLMTEQIAEPLDHGFIVYRGDGELREAFEGRGWKWIAFPYVPTAENIARWCWDQLADPIERRFRDGLRLVGVRVHETPTSIATYRGART